MESAGEEKEYEKVAGFFMSMQTIPRTKSNNLPKQQLILDMFSWHRSVFGVGLMGLLTDLGLEKQGKT